MGSGEDPCCKSTCAGTVRAVRHPLWIPPVPPRPLQFQADFDGPRVGLGGRAWAQTSCGFRGGVASGTPLRNRATFKSGEVDPPVAKPKGNMDLVVATGRESSALHIVTVSVRPAAAQRGIAFLWVGLWHIRHVRATRGWRPTQYIFLQDGCWKAKDLMHVMRSRCVRGVSHGPFQGP